MDRKARLVSKEVFVAPPDRTPGCLRVELEFVVGTDGEPELNTVRTVHATNNSFARSVIETLPQWKYEPALVGGVPVRQIVTTERKMGVVVVVTRAGSAPAPSRAPNPC